MNTQYKNLVFFALIFSFLTYFGIKFIIFGSFLGGLYLSNGVAHFLYGAFGFGKITPKKLFGDARIIHLIWGTFNFIFSSILIYYSRLEINWFIFIVAVVITFLFLPAMVKKE